jgi:hypothetical protein
VEHLCLDPLCVRAQSFVVRDVHQRVLGLDVGLDADEPADGLAEEELGQLHGGEDADPKARYIDSLRDHCDRDEPRPGAPGEGVDALVGVRDVRRDNLDVGAKVAQEAGNAVGVRNAVADHEPGGVVVVAAHLAQRVVRVAEHVGQEVLRRVDRRA